MPIRLPLPRLASVRALSCLLLVLGTALRAQDELPRVTVPIAPSPPKIDGTLEDSEWQGAVRVSGFRQVEPQEGAAPSERTEILLMVDKDALYIGLLCYDREPDKVVRTQVVRDANLDPDDRVEMLFDTFFDRRNAFWFQINASGCRGDALIGDNGGSFNKQWDGIWYGEGRVFEGGWCAEVALPAKTLGMSDEHPTFGFNARRFIRRRNEVVEWSTPLRTRPFFQVASSGIIDGVGSLEQGLGIDLRPFVTVRGTRNSVRNGNGYAIEPGFDLRWRLSPGLSATFTVNTDFAETEVDSRVVNLTRFPVFFPELRDFFLEDASIFEFGGLRRSLVPFFSRRVGLGPTGSPVPILAGAKLTGREGPWNVGLMHVVTDETRSVELQNLSVARVAYNVLKESQVGFIATHGDPSGEGSNALVGADFLFRTREFLGDKNLRIESFVVGTRDAPDDEAESWGHAFGVRARYPNELYEFNLAYWQFGRDLQPDLGFIRRRGVRRLFGDATYRPRPVNALVRRVIFSLRPDVYWRIADGELDTFTLSGTLPEFQFESGDRVGLTFRHEIDNLNRDFSIADGITVPRDRYQWSRFGVTLETAEQRPFSVEASYTLGGFYSGQRQTINLEANWRVRPGLGFAATWQHNRIDLDQGSFITNLATFRAGVDFGPYVSWNTFFQYDDVSGSLGLQSRLRWIIEPGNDLFIVLGQSFLTEDESDRFTLRVQRTDLTAKIAWTFRF